MTPNKYDKYDECDKYDKQYKYDKIVKNKCDKYDIFSMLPSEIQALMSKWGEPAYRGNQIFEWFHRHNIDNFTSMDNIPMVLRTRLNDECCQTPCKIIEKKSSAHDGTIKYLFELGNDTIIESVHMKYSYGNCVCISTQAGCRMGCRFCASTIGGLLRNLTAGEMCAQVYAAAKDGGKISSVVLMGCGEPLDNFEQVLRFIDLITNPRGAALGARHITISTCGLIPQMRELAALKLQINLAVSLHASNDETREALMPIARSYSIQETLEACRHYISMTNRRITFEYALAKGINDKASDAEKLASLLRGMLCHVNLIPINNIDDKNSDKKIDKKNQKYGNFFPAAYREAEKFATILQGNKIQTTIRRTIGADVNAACGQLRARGIALMR